jgi:nicotinamide-nucleotide amidase
LSETLEAALPDHLDEQAERLMHRLCDKDLTVATAESCTGGMLAALLTDIEGAGHGFDRGFVTYSSKSSIALGVTGFAGPAGPNHEEGLVHFAVASRGKPTRHRVEHFGSIGRGPVRVKSLKILLEMLEQVLEQA